MAKRTATARKRSLPPKGKLPELLSTEPAPAAGLSRRTASYIHIAVPTLVSADAGTWDDAYLPLAAGTSWSDPVPGARSERWRNDLKALPSAPLDYELPDPAVQPSGPNSDPFHWLWTLGADDADSLPWDAHHLSTAFSKRALKGAVIANGGALVALALMAPLLGTNFVGTEMAMALGLILACVSTILAYVNFQLSDLLLTSDYNAKARIRSRVTASFWLAIIAGAGSYAAFAMGAVGALMVVS